VLKSSLLEIIRTFSKEDLVKFEDFVKSPYHNKKSNVVKLFLAIKKFSPAFDDPGLSKEEAWKKVFPGKKYNYGIMKNLIHDLAKLAESYLSHFNFNKDFSYNRHLIRELHDRKMYSAFFNKLEKFESKNVPSELKSSEFFFNKVFIDRIKHEHSENRAAIQENKKEVFKNLIQYFLDYLLGFAQSVYIEEQRVKVTHDYPLIKVIMEFLEKNPELIEGSDVIKIKYYTILCFFSDFDETGFEHLRRIYLNAKDKLSRSDNFAVNSNIAVIYETIYQKGILKYEKEFLSIMINAVEENLYSDVENDYIDMYSFADVIAICRRNYDSKSLRKFVDKNIHRIHPDKRESMMNYCLSGIFFIEKDYEKFIEYTAKTNFNGFFESTGDNCYFKISSKCYLLYCYYELNYTEEVLTEIDSSLHFLKNNSLISVYTRLSMENFFKTLKKITLLKLKYDEISLRKIRNEIVNFKKVSFRNWLLKKIDELGK
jgi:hypothetical protein